MMDMKSSLLLLPYEQLTLAWAHETGELQRYRRLTLSFLPRTPQTSRLMATLGLQCENRIETLRQAAEQLELEACVKATPKANPSYHLRYRNFFVVDDAMANQVIEQAVRSAVESKQFFEWLLNTNATAELHQPLVNFISEKEAECHVLLEFWEQSHAPGLLRQA